MGSSKQGEIKMITTTYRSLWLRALSITLTLGIAACSGGGGGGGPLPEPPNKGVGDWKPIDKDKDITDDDEQLKIDFLENSNQIRAGHIEYTNAEVQLAAIQDELAPLEAQLAPLETQAENLSNELSSLEVFPF